MSKKESDVIVKESEQCGPKSTEDIVKALEKLRKSTESAIVQMGQRLEVLEDRHFQFRGRTDDNGGLRHGMQSHQLDLDESNEPDNCSSTEAYEFGYPTKLRRKKKVRVRTPLSMAGSLGRKVHATDSSSGFSVIQSGDLQAEYVAIRDSLMRQKLPKDLRFTGSVKGIKSQNKDTAKAYSVSGRFIETCLKLVTNIQSTRDVQCSEVAEEVDDLLICLIAHLRVVQEEHCMLAVGGNYGPRTSND